MVVVVIGMIVAFAFESYFRSICCNAGPRDCQWQSRGMVGWQHSQILIAGWTTVTKAVRRIVDVNVAGDFPLCIVRDAVQIIVVRVAITN